MEGSFCPFHSLRFSLSTRAEKAQGRYQGMKGAGAEPERLSGVCDKYVTNKVQTGARKMSVPLPGLCSQFSLLQKRHDDLKSEVFQAITTCFFKPPALVFTFATHIWTVSLAHHQCRVTQPCPSGGAGSAINYLFLGFKNTPVSHHGRTQPLLEALQHVPRRQLRLRVCCWPERRQQLQRVQAGLCWETPTKVFFWAAEISNEE